MTELEKYQAICKTPEDLDVMIKRFTFNAQAMADILNQQQDEIEHLRGILYVTYIYPDCMFTESN